MPTRMLLLADTHLPVRAKRLSPAVWDAVESADVVVHAGDWVSVDLLDELESRSARLIGVWGNNDGEELRRRLPEVARESVDGVRIAVMHETGAATGREARCDVSYPDTDLLVFGTATSRGTRRRHPGFACSTRALPPTGGASRSRPS